MSHDRLRSLTGRLKTLELRRLAECFDHAMTKPHLALIDLLPTLVRGHHQISGAMRDRILAAIKTFREDELNWLAEHIHELAHR